MVKSPKMPPWPGSAGVAGISKVILAITKAGWNMGDMECKPINIWHVLMAFEGIGISRNNDVVGKVVFWSAKTVICFLAWYQNLELKQQIWAFDGRSEVSRCPLWRCHQMMSPDETLEAQITPNLHLEKLNPNIDLSGFHVLMCLGEIPSEGKNG